MHIDAQAGDATDPEIVRILDELKSVADDVYPITVAIDPRYPVHTRLGTIEVFPDTMTPAAWSSTGVGLSKMMRKCLIEMGILGADADMEFQGFFYGACATNISSYINFNRRLPGAPWWPWSKHARAIIQDHADPITGWEPPDNLLVWLADCYWRLRGYEQCRRLEISLQEELTPREIELQRAEAEVANANYDSLDIQGLLDELRKPSLNAALVRLHMATTIYVGSHYMKLATEIARLTSLPPIQTANGLLQALGDVESTKPALALRAIAAEMRAAPRLAELLRAKDFDGFAQAVAAPKDPAERRAGEARAEFLRQYGYRGIGEAAFDATTWAEDPKQADALLALYLEEGPDHQAGASERRRNLEREVLAAMPNERSREAMRSYIANAQKFAAMRERTKSMSVRQSLRTRRLLKALTARLVERGVFDSAEDREMLSFKEFVSAAKMDREALRALIARRRKAYELLRKLDIVEVTFKGMPTPRLKGGHGTGTMPAGTVLNGLCLSPGRIEGIARVVRDPRDGANIRPGEILVAPYTDAAWSPLFLLASGVVIDSATLISHGATVARELALPAVANVPGTTAIADGDRILIDAGAARVTILSRGEGAGSAAAGEPKVRSAFAFTPSRLAALRSLRLKGRASTETIAYSAGLTPEAIAADLEAAAGAGLCARSGGDWAIAPAGFDWCDEALVRERPEKAAAESLYEDFLPMNSAFKQLVFDWQMRDPETINDHTDAAYDAAVLARLDSLDHQMKPILARATTLIPRLEPFGRRFAAALTQLKGGDRKYFTAPMVDSYHTIWFEFHEELITMAGRSRKDEAQAGRAA